MSFVGSRTESRLRVRTYRWISDGPSFRWSPDDLGRSSTDTFTHAAVLWRPARSAPVPKTQRLLFALGSRLMTVLIMHQSRWYMKLGPAPATRCRTKSAGKKRSEMWWRREEESTGARSRASFYPSGYFRARRWRGFCGKCRTGHRGRALLTPYQHFWGNSRRSLWNTHPPETREFFSVNSFLIDVPAVLEYNTGCRKCERVWRWVCAITLAPSPATNLYRFFLVFSHQNVFPNRERGWSEKFPTSTWR